MDAVPRVKRTAYKRKRPEMSIPSVCAEVFKYSCGDSLRLKLCDLLVDKIVEKKFRSIQGEEFCGFSTPDVGSL